jgi:hypothetical protein
MNLQAWHLGGNLVRRTDTKRLVRMFMIRVKVSQGLTFMTTPTTILCRTITGRA